MEQNNTYNQSDTTQNEDFVKLQQWLSLCISKWHWFLTSMIVVGGLAAKIARKRSPANFSSPSLIIFIP